MGNDHAKPVRKHRRKAKPEANAGKNKGGAYGPGGFCLCTKCGVKIPHRTNQKCTSRKCPECGHVMVREELVEAASKK